MYVCGGYSQVKVYVFGGYSQVKGGSNRGGGGGKWPLPSPSVKHKICKGGFDTIWHQLPVVYVYMSNGMIISHHIFEKFTPESMCILHKKTELR